jgi:hypothetical protein
LKTHLTGVLNHERETIGYFDLHQWPHDSNLTINVLLRALTSENGQNNRPPLSSDGQLLAGKQKSICYCFSCCIGLSEYLQKGTKGNCWVLYFIKTKTTLEPQIRENIIYKN